MIGATALFFGAHLTPRPTGDGRIIQLAVDNPDSWTTAALMLMVASLGFLVGISCFVPLLHRRGFAPGVAGMLMIALSAVLMAGLSMQLVLLRGLSIHSGVSSEDLSGAMGDPFQQALLAAAFGSFFAGELLLAWALGVARTTPRWVPLMFVGHVLGSGLVRILQVPELDDIPTIFMVAAFAGTAIAVNRSDVGARRPAQIRTRPGRSVA